MKITFSNKNLAQTKADAELVIVIGKDLKHKWVKDKDVLNRAGFTGDADETCHLPQSGRLYVGAETDGADDLRIAAALAARALKKKKLKTLKVGLYGSEVGEGIKALALGFLMGGYGFENYKSEKSPVWLSTVAIANEHRDKRTVIRENAEAAIKEAAVIARAVNYVRDAVNTVPEEMNPLTMSKLARDLARKHKLTVKVFGEGYIKKQGMGAFHTVSKASPYPPQLIHLTYKPKQAKSKIILVGKGLTFDAGGLSLKPSDGMVTMKCDMAGGAAILGVMQAVSDLALPVEVHGIVGATENVVGRHSFKPGDVVKAMNGKTIEIKNTDAEGRLVLADCLAYAQREVKADRIVDIATLTGACVVALGEYTAGIMAHDQTLVQSLQSAGAKSGELTAYLPFNRYLSKGLKSEVADISNVTAKRWGGAITAALFLDEFIEPGNKDKWAHIDIAGPSYVEESWGEHPFGATGAGVRLLVEWLKSL